MKFITVERLNEYINNNKVREKDKADFLELGDLHYWLWIKIVRDWLINRKGASQSVKGSETD